MPPLVTEPLDRFFVDKAQWRRALKHQGLSQKTLAARIGKNAAWFSKKFHDTRLNASDPVIRRIMNEVPLTPINWTSKEAGSALESLMKLSQRSEFRHRFGKLEPGSLDEEGANAVLRVIDALSQAEGEHDPKNTTDRIDEIFRIILANVEEIATFDYLQARMSAAVESVLPPEEDPSVYPPGITTPELYHLAARLSLKVRQVATEDGVPRSFVAKVPDGLCLYLSSSLSAEARRAEVAAHIGHLVLEGKVPAAISPTDGPKESAETAAALERVRLLVEKLVALLDNTAAPGNGPAGNAWCHRFLKDQLAKTFAGSLLLPRDGFLAELKRTGVDIRRLAAMFRVSVETVVLRTVLLSTDKRVRAKYLLPQFHCLKTDLGGNLLYRCGGDYDGIPGTTLFPRRLGTCSRWASVRALRRPAEPTYQVSEFESGTQFFCVSFVVTGSHPSGQFTWFSISLGCKASEASKLVYYKYADLTVTKVGGACIVCTRADCNDRAVRNPSIQEHDLTATSILRIRMEREWQPITIAVGHEVENLLAEAVSSPTRRVKAIATVVANDEEK